MKIIPKYGRFVHDIWFIFSFTDDLFPGYDNEKL